MSLGKLTDYAMVLLINMSQSQEGHQKSHTLAKATNLNLPTVAKVLKMLAAKGILSSQRGVHGGFKLCLPLEEISLLMVVEAMEGPVALTECCIPQAVECALYGKQCQMVPGIRSVNQIVADMLQRINLRTILEEGREEPELKPELTPPV